MVELTLSLPHLQFPTHWNLCFRLHNLQKPSIHDSVTLWPMLFCNHNSLEPADKFNIIKMISFCLSWNHSLNINKKQVNLHFRFHSVGAETKLPFLFSVLIAIITCIASHPQLGRVWQMTPKLLSFLTNLGCAPLVQIIPSQRSPATARIPPACP